MADVRVHAEREVDAPAHLVYRVVADFERHHPRFLPPAFSEFRVERGGVGAGTVAAFRITTSGRSREYRMEVTEPQPGCVLVESDTDSSLVTTWTVDPRGPACRVSIDTTWQGASGVGGFFERLFAPRVLARLYADELERLERYAREQLVA